MLVRVLTDDGGSKPVGLLARVVENKNDETYVIQYLSSTEEKDSHGRTIYAYENDTYEIDDDYVIEYIDDEYDVGFIRGDDGWIKRRRSDDDENYEPSDEEEEDEDEESQGVCSADEDADDEFEDYDVDDD